MPSTHLKNNWGCVFHFTLGAGEAPEHAGTCVGDGQDVGKIQMLHLPLFNWFLN